MTLVIMSNELEIVWGGGRARRGSTLKSVKVGNHPHCGFSHIRSKNLRASMFPPATLQVNPVFVFMFPVPSPVPIEHTVRPK